MRIRTGETAGSRVIRVGPARAGGGKAPALCADRAGGVTGDGVLSWAMGEAGRGEMLDAAGVLSRLRRS